MLFRRRRRDACCRHLIRSSSGKCKRVSTALNYSHIPNSQITPISPVGQTGKAGNCSSAAGASYDGEKILHAFKHFSALERVQIFLKRLKNAVPCLLFSFG